MELGEEEDFVGVDVADAGDDLLVEQRRLDPARSLRELGGELVDRDEKSVRPLRTGERFFGRVAIGKPGDSAQTSRVAIPDDSFRTFQVKRQARMAQASRRDRLEILRSCEAERR